MYTLWKLYTLYTIYTLVQGVLCKWMCTPCKLCTLHRMETISTLYVRFAWYRLTMYTLYLLYALRSVAFTKHLQNRAHCETETGWLHIVFCVFYVLQESVNQCEIINNKHAPFPQNHTRWTYISDTSCHPGPGLQIPDHRTSKISGA